MGSEQVFQPLTREDRITVALYRSGIVMSAIIVSYAAFLLAGASSHAADAHIGRAADILAWGLYASVGMSVFFIHLYVGKFKRFLILLYLLGLCGLIALLYIGRGSVTAALLTTPYATLLLLPLSGCLGFVTAKEAFCFRLFEGYLLAMIMPVYLVLVSLTGRGASSGLTLIAAMLVIFTLRKVFMPAAYDIGDKTAYR